MEDYFYLKISVERLTIHIAITSALCIWIQTSQKFSELATYANTTWYSVIFYTKDR